ncbi:MAG: hypothetical protein ACR2LQ_04895 [Acidimicrobiales bacterium]
MAITVDGPRVAIADVAGTRGWIPRAVVGGLVGVGATVVVLYTAVIGTGGDSRIANPNPTGKVLVDGVPRPEPGLWGISNWPAVFGLAFLVVAGVFLAGMVIQSIRARRASQSLMVFSAVAILASLDPPANWVTFTVYNPELIHFPTTWAWMRLAPSVEPLLVVPGYPFYYFTIALMACGLGRRVVLARLRAGSWLRRHPRTTLALVGFVVANLWDVPMELLMIRARMYTYSQWWGPSIHVGNAHAGLPIVWTLFTTVSITAVTTLLYRSDDGSSTLSILARRLPHLARRTATSQPTGQSAGRQIIAGAVVLAVVYVGLAGFFGAFRVTGSATNTPKGGWPYGEIKTYDPDGTVHDAGIPGPYYW